MHLDRRFGLKVEFNLDNLIDADQTSHPSPCVNLLNENCLTSFFSGTVECCCGTKEEN